MFGNHITECNEFLTSSVESRIKDIHTAFADTTISGILTVIGGYSTNQILEYLDYNLIKNNPKIVCGFSDITMLHNAILAKT
ncbi:MAG: LD-carboxypeptidase [Candidatus Peribacteria bacterium]|nr:LD-carboxypeptidase [Candidatus Peribacteria bacterium]